MEHKGKKQLIVIIGPNAVGKTTTAKKLIELYSHSAYVDSDWCRAMNAFKLTDVTKLVVENNIYCLLLNYLSCEEINKVVFTYSWHGRRKEVYDNVMKKLRSFGIEFQEKIIILKCDEAENRKRAIADGRNKERIDRGMKNTFSFYDEFDYPCINTTHMTPTEVTEKIVTLL